MIFQARNNIGAVLCRADNNKYAQYLLFFTSGILGALPYFEEKLFILTFVSLFLQLYFVIRFKCINSRSFSSFFLYYFGTYLFLYSFLSELYPYERFGFTENQAVFVLICSCLLIPLLHAFVMGMIFWISKFFPEDRLYIVFGYASLFVIGEWVLSLGSMAFPWGGISVSLTGILPYLQTISMFGKYFITFITVASCGCFAFSLLKKEKSYSYIGIAVILCNFLLGTALWYIPADNNSSVNAAVLQGNVLSNEKWQSGNSQLFFDRYILLTEQAAKGGAEIIVLPETAIPITFSENGRIHKALSEIAREYEVTIIAGVHFSDYEIGENYNSVIAILPDGTLSARYDKRHLVPFGEFIPFADLIGEFLPFIKEFNEGTSNLTQGEQSVIVSTEHGDISALVCFDSIFTEFAQEATKNGAEMIAVVTNDSWFNDSVGVYTHLRHSQIRAIENGRCVLRAANTGVSALINDKGIITEASEPLTVATVHSVVYSNNRLNLYTYIGNIVLFLSFIIIFFLIYHYMRNDYGKNKTT